MKHFLFLWVCIFYAISPGTLYSYNQDCGSHPVHLKDSHHSTSSSSSSSSYDWSRGSIQGPLGVVVSVWCLGKIAYNWWTSVDDTSSKEKEEYTYNELFECHAEQYPFLYEERDDIFHWATNLSQLKQIIHEKIEQKLIWQGIYLDSMPGCALCQSSDDSSLCEAPVYQGGDSETSPPLDKSPEEVLAEYQEQQIQKQIKEGDFFDSAQILSPRLQQLYDERQQAVEQVQNGSVVSLQRYDVADVIHDFLSQYELQSSSLGLVHGNQLTHCLHRQILSTLDVCAQNYLPSYTPLQKDLTESTTHMLCDAAKANEIGDITTTCQLVDLATAMKDLVAHDHENFGWEVLKGMMQGAGNTARKTYSFAGKLCRHPVDTTLETITGTAFGIVSLGQLAWGHIPPVPSDCAYFNRYPQLEEEYERKWNECIKHWERTGSALREWFDQPVRERAAQITEFSLDGLVTSHAVKATGCLVKHGMKIGSLAKSGQKCAKSQMLCQEFIGACKAWKKLPSKKFSYSHQKILAQALYENNMSLSQFDDILLHIKDVPCFYDFLEELIATYKRRCHTSKALVSAACDEMVHVRDAVRAGKIQRHHFASEGFAQGLKNGSSSIKFLKHNEPLPPTQEQAQKIIAYLRESKRRYEKLQLLGVHKEQFIQHEFEALHNWGEEFCKFKHLREYWKETSFPHPETGLPMTCGIAVEHIFLPELRWGKGKMKLQGFHSDYFGIMEILQKSGSFCSKDVVIKGRSLPDGYKIKKILYHSGIKAKEVNLFPIKLHPYELLDQVKKILNTVSPQRHKNFPTRYVYQFYNETGIKIELVLDIKSNKIVTVFPRLFEYM